MAFDLICLVEFWCRPVAVKIWNIRFRVLHPRNCPYTFIWIYIYNTPMELQSNTTRWKSCTEMWSMRYAYLLLESLKRSKVPYKLKCANVHCFNEAFIDKRKVRSIRPSVRPTWDISAYFKQTAQVIEFKVNGCDYCGASSGMVNFGLVPLNSPCALPHDYTFLTNHVGNWPHSSSDTPGWYNLVPYLVNFCYLLPSDFRPVSAQFGTTP